jgi:hypothetical protein
MNFDLEEMSASRHLHGPESIQPPIEPLFGAHTNIATSKHPGCGNSCTGELPDPITLLVRSPRIRFRALAGGRVSVLAVRDTGHPTCMAAMRKTCLAR